MYVVLTYWPYTLAIGAQLRINKCIFVHVFSITILQYLNLASLKDPAINDIEDFKHLEQSMD